MTKVPEKSHIWDRHPDDWYVEPEWCSRRLFEVETFEGVIYDPACGFGRIVEQAQAAGYRALGGDKVRRSDQWCHEVIDFMHDGRPRDNIVSNPPFAIADAFVAKALNVASKVAMLLPLAWVAGDERAAWLGTTPLFRVYVLTPRPSMPPGPVIEAGEKPGGGKKDFCWVVWLNRFDGLPTFHHLRRDG